MTHVLLVLGILAACMVGLIALVVMARWLVRLGETRIGLALIDSTRPDAHDVADTEAALMPPDFDLGRTTRRRLNLAARLDAYRNETT